MSAEAERSFRAHIRPRLHELGFRRWHAGIPALPGIGPDCVGTIGFNTAHRGYGRHQVNILPVAGVRHDGVEDLKASVFSRLVVSDSAITIVSPIRYLTPIDTGDWLYEDGPVGEGAVEQIVEVIRDHAVPWMREHATLDGILEAALAGQCYDYTVPSLVLFMLGRYTEARQAAEEMLREFDGSLDPAEWDNERSGFMNLIERIDDASRAAPPR